MFTKKLCYFFICVSCFEAFSCADEFTPSSKTTSKRLKEQHQEPHVLRKDTHMGIYGFYRKGTPLSVIERNVKRVDIKMKNY